jgi:putative transposase
MVNAIFLYVLALAARRFGVLVHAFCVMSNHVHMVVTDPDARLPAFSQYLDSIVARAVNAYHGRWEAFWATGSYSAVPLDTAADVVEKVAYVLANPAAAGLVRRGTEWPGLWSPPMSFGAAPLAAPRPDGFFRKNGYLPPVAYLELTVPPGLASVEEYRGRVQRELDAIEERACRQRDQSGLAFLGVARVLAQEPGASPRPIEPRRELNPRIAGRDAWKRLEAISRLGAFISDYRDAWRARRAGDHRAVFPAGTYLMRVLHGAPCAAAG